MGELLVDSNVMLDVFTQDPVWFNWSSRTLDSAVESNALVINPIIYAEVSCHFSRKEELDAILRAGQYDCHPLPLEAAFLAGQTFLKYRRSGGVKRSPLPDFFIGAHATFKGMTLLTRDDGRYRTYFPALKIISPG